MKKKYTNQIYEEGLGASVFVPVDNAIKNNTKKTRKVLSIGWKIIYTLLAVLVAALLFWLTFPLK